MHADDVILVQWNHSIGVTLQDQYFCPLQTGGCFKQVVLHRICPTETNCNSHNSGWVAMVSSVDRFQPGLAAPC